MSTFSVKRFESEYSIISEENPDHKDIRTTLYHLYENNNSTFCSVLDVFNHQNLNFKSSTNDT